MALPSWHWANQPNRKKMLEKIGAGRKGTPAWNKGKSTGPQSLELRLKRGEAIKKNLPRTAFKPGQAPHNKGGTNDWMIGEKNPRWKNDATRRNAVARRAPEQLEWRMRVLVRDDFTCQLCGAEHSHVADHIESFADHPELRTELSNGRTLCHDCHRKTPSYLKS